MKSSLLSSVFVLFAFGLVANADLRPKYYGADHSEANFSFVGKILLEQRSEPSRSQVDTALRKQLRYMLGLMRSRAAQAAALYPQWDFKVLEINKTSSAAYLVQYELTSKGVFANGVRKYTFTLPLNPSKIFSQAEGKCMVEEAGESNFWYHWEPLLAGCPLIEDQDYYNLTVPVKPIPNTTQTYPEYQKLVDANNSINMTFFFGFEKYDYPKWIPEGTDDWGIVGYNRERDFLRSLGFKERPWSLHEIEEIYVARDGFVPYVSEFYLEGRQANVRIRLVLCDTGLDHHSRAFHTFLKESLEKESVVVYNGHSGIGKNLNLASIEKMRGISFKFNPKYQIYFLGSCVPYAYYTDMFFQRKRSASDPLGTLNLDILSYAKESIFGNSEDQMLTQAIALWAKKGKKTSYQEIINQSPNYFIGVSGDEDNPRR